MLIQMLAMARVQPVRGPGLQHVPTFGLHVCFITAISRVRLLEDTDDEFVYWTDMREVRAWLIRFQGKWKLAGMSRRSLVPGELRVVC